MLIEEDLFVANPLPTNNGYSWTLASRLGEMLHRAEQLFGPRDQSYTILGVEFSSGTPQLWYPGSRKHIVIQLTNECLTDSVRAHYQLAHESVHLLAPTGGKNANVLEEGLAMYFADTYLHDIFAKFMPPGLTSYAAAAEKVRQLLAIDQNLVRTLRIKQPAIHLTTADDILAVRPDVPRDLAECLVKPFIR